MTDSTLQRIEQQLGRHLFLQDVELDLQGVIANLQPDIKYLHVYCHHVVCKTSADGEAIFNLPESSQLRYIKIFAQSFLRNNPDIKGFRFVCLKSIKVNLFFEETPDQLSAVGPNHEKYVIAREPIPEMGEESKGDSQWDIPGQDEIEKYFESKMKEAENSRVVGWLIEVSPSSLAKPKELSDLPSGELRRRGAQEAIGEYDLDKNPFVTNFLAELLNNLFTTACELVFDGLITSGNAAADRETTAIKYLRFIRRCTSHSADFSALDQDAATLLERLELPRNYPAGEKPETLAGKYYIPSLGSKAYDESLESDLKFAEELQGRIEGIDTENRLTAVIRNTAATVLDTIAKVGLVEIPNDVHHEEMRVSMSVVSQRREELEKRSSTLKTQKNTFNNGVKKYGEKKKHERDLAIAKGVGEIAVALVIGLCTNPSAATLSVKDLAVTVKDAVVTAMSEAKEAPGDTAGGEAKMKGDSKSTHVLKKVGGAALSAGPKIYTAYTDYKNNPVLNENAEVAKRGAIDKSLEESKKEATLIITSSTPPIDYLGLTANWDEIKTGVDEMFATLIFKLKDDTIEGLEEYRTALSNLIIRGQALIEAQRQLQENISKFYRGLAESEIRKQKLADIEAAVTSLKTTPQTASALLSARLCDLRSSIYVLKRTIVLDFHLYLLSLRYQSSRLHLIEVKVNPTMKVVELRDKVNYLKATVKAKKGGQHNTQKLDCPITISTVENPKSIFAENWKEVLLNCHRLLFQIPSNFEQGSNYFDKRITHVSAKFFTQADEALKRVTYEVYLGPQFFDRSEKGHLYQYYLTEFHIRKTDNEGDWLFSDQKGDAASTKPAIGGAGLIYLPREDIKHFSLEDINRVDVTFEAEGVLFPKSKYAPIGLAKWD